MIHKLLEIVHYQGMFQYCLSFTSLNFNNLLSNFLSFALIFVHKGWLVVGYKTNCLLVGSGPVDGMASMGAFLRDPSPYFREFRRKQRKTPNG